MATVGPLTKLGTTWWFEFFDVDEEQSENITARLINEMDRFETAYSRFRSDSLLSQLNASGEMVGADAEFRELLTIGLNAYTQTNGVFNIAVGAHLEASGYDANYSFESKAELPPVPMLPEVLNLTDTAVTLSRGARLDFGGFGKGYLIDNLANILRAENLSQQFLINGGGDMYATDKAGEAIVINLADPADPGHLVGSLPLYHCGFAASSPHLRQWRYNGKTHHHLVGNETAVGVYVVAQTATEADIWSTTLSLDQKQKPPPTVRWWCYGEDKKLHAQN